MRRALGRRAVLGGLAAVAVLGASACGREQKLPMDRDDLDDELWRLPAEGEDHERTWMAYGVPTDDRGADAARVRDCVTAIAAAITAFEPVTILVRPGDAAEAKKRLDPKVTVVETNLKDLWIRGSGPAFVRDGSRLGAVDIAGGPVDDAEAQVASFVAEQAGARSVETDLVVEGGALEVDGEGTAIVAESAVLGGNRNQGWTKETAERELRRLFGLRTIIWLPGVRPEDGPPGGWARFAGEGQVVAARPGSGRAADEDVLGEQMRTLREARDADGERLKVTTVAPSALDYYLCNGGLILANQSDSAADAAAREALGHLYPGRKIATVDTQALASSGGLRAVTLPQPVVD